MKRTFWWLLIILMTVVLNACTDGESVEEIPASMPTVMPTLPPSPAPTVLPDDATTAARIRARGKLNVGVRYDAAVAQWSIFNEDLAVMDEDVSFNVTVASRECDGTTQFAIHQATDANSSGESTSGRSIAT